jgi:hypothetical protein
MRFTNDTPQLPRAIDAAQRRILNVEWIVYSELLSQLQAQFRRDVWILSEIGEGVSGRESNNGKKHEADSEKGGYCDE